MAAADRVRSWSLGRWPTGLKLMVVLSAALLPLVVIAMFATLQTTRLANMENRSRLRVASAESARSLAIELVGDMTALRVATVALAADAGDAPSCARVQGVFAHATALGGRFVIAGRDGRPICGTAFASAVPAAPSDGPVAANVLPGIGLVLSIRDRPSGLAAAGYFPAPFLAAISRPSGFSAPYGAELTHGGRRLSLVRLARQSALERRQTSYTALGIADLSLEMQVRSAPITSPMIVALVLPFLMWAAAVTISWFVVDRLLIRPLRQLRSSVAAFVPGEAIDPGEVRALPAQEIRELGDTFRTISRTVALHEAGLAEGLQRQTKLTREVHHRVKNNLQVISSLINIHARGARTDEATLAYASIGRRVDALAVVHRNHFAEAEENRGLSARAMLGELASNIRATAPERSEKLGIVLDVDPFFVNQDVAVAMAFLVTETVELALTCEPEAQLRISLKPGSDEGRAVLRVISRALVDGDALRAALGLRFGRVLEGLSRQLRAPLHHDPLTGAYEIAVSVLGRD